MPLILFQFSILKYSKIGLRHCLLRDEFFEPIFKFRVRVEKIELIKLGQLIIKFFYFFQFLGEEESTFVC